MNVVRVATKQPMRSRAKRMVRGCVGIQGCRSNAEPNTPQHDRFVRLDFDELWPSSGPEEEPEEEEEWADRRPFVSARRDHQLALRFFVGEEAVPLNLLRSADV